MNYAAKPLSELRPGKPVHDDFSAASPLRDYGHHSSFWNNE